MLALLGAACGVLQRLRLRGLPRLRHGACGLLARDVPGESPAVPPAHHGGGRAPDVDGEECD
eukprot:4869358-Pyramimonas_sp.AAC.1